jgi:uncharacterized repeat protein (TIGR03803 family)
MKKNLLLFTILILLISNCLIAQTQLWGTTQRGGTNNYGTIFKLSNGNILNYVHEFAGGINGQQPMGNLCLVNNEYIYGTTVDGGINDKGICYKININTLVFTKIHDFTDTTGGDDVYGLLKGNDGNLYGTTYNGTIGGPVIYKINPVTDAFTVLATFNSYTGMVGGVWELINNKLYGLTNFHGANGLGTIFSFDLGTNTFAVLHNNDALTGYGGGSILNVGGGMLIGVANSDYQNATNPQYPVLYSYDLNTNTRTIIHQFDTLTGFGVPAKLVLANDGKIYGSASKGGSSYPNNFDGDGVVFSYDLNTNTYTVLHNFEFAVTGRENQCGMMQASDGLLYSATYLSAKAFSYDIVTNTFSIVNNFSNIFGIQPSSPFLEIGTVTSATNKFHSINISVLPNPAEDFIVIDNNEKASNVTCTDILGREIEQIQLAGFGKTKVDVSAYPNVFFVKDNKGEVIKVMKN